LRELDPDTLRYDKAMRRLVGEGTVVVARALCNEGFHALRCFSPKANPVRLRFILISKDGRLETAFELDRNA